MLYFFSMTDEKNDDQSQPIQSEDDLFWQAMNAGNKTFLCKTVFKCCYKGNPLQKLLAGLVVHGVSIFRDYNACPYIPSEVLQIGWNLISMFELIICCDLVMLPSPTNISDVNYCVAFKNSLPKKNPHCSNINRQ